MPVDNDGAGTRCAFVGDWEAGVGFETMKWQASVRGHAGGYGSNATVVKTDISRLYSFTVAGVVAC